jgi:hypothetical protein
LAAVDVKMSSVTLTLGCARSNSCCIWFITAIRGGEFQSVARMILTGCALCAGWAGLPVRTPQAASTTPALTPAGVAAMVRRVAR